MSQASTWMIYGANGYTGKLCVRECVRRGIRPVLAGRNRKAIEALAREYDLESRIFGLDDAKAANRLDDMAAVLHCAGPFSATARPMLDLCTRSKTHYLDITGEIDVFEFVHQSANRWIDAGMVAMPGVGFDVVPSDCLAAMLKRELPDATHLTLAFQSKGGKMSPGTTKTMIEGLPRGCRVRRDGQLVSVPSGSLTRAIPFRDRPHTAVAIPWGDVSTAYYSTGIPNIEVYAGIPEKQIAWMRRLNKLGPILGLGFVQDFLKRRVEKSVSGPTDDERASDEVILWGEARDGSGNTRTMRMRTPEGYALTAEAAVTAAERVASGAVPPGAHTPSAAFGADFVLSLTGVNCDRA
ncbi:MAG: saccharopine dehydrogenase [Candidatus Hydrogenedentota bacterium]